MSQKTGTLTLTLNKKGENIMDRAVTGINKIGNVKTIAVEQGGFERYVQSHNVQEFNWCCAYIGYTLIKEVQRSLYINSLREKLGLHAIDLIVSYRNSQIRIVDWDDVTKLQNIMLENRLQQEQADIRVETKAFIQEQNISPEDIAYTDTAEFAKLCKAYDISIGQTPIEILKANVTFIRNWDYRMARDAGFENQNDLGLSFNKERTKTIYVTTLLDKLKALVTLRYYEQYLKASKKVITDGYEYKVITTLDELPEGWKNTPLSAGALDEYERVCILPVSAAPGRNRKIAGDPNTNYEDFYIQ